MEYLKVTKVENVVMYRRGQKMEGTLHLTTHHIIFTIPTNEEGKRPLEIWFCYPMIEQVDFNRGSAMLFEFNGTVGMDGGLGDSTGNVIKDGITSLSASGITNSISNGLGFGNVINRSNGLDMKEDHSDNEIETRLNYKKLVRGGSIRIQFRDFSYVAFDFKNILKCNDVFDSMMKMTCIDGIEKLYAFIYEGVKSEIGLNGWKIYNFEKEFERQRVDLSKWRVTSLNEDYQLCATYPKKLIVPASITDSMLKHGVKYRSKNRFPALTYYYKKSGCSIIRCAQPMVGIKQARSIQDENIIREIFKTNNLEEGKNIIVDARPVTNAMAQVALGAGTEMMEYYGKNTRKLFLNIENIHVMRDSLSKVKNILRHSDVNGCNYKIDEEALMKSGWLDHVSKLLKATELLVKHFIYEGVNLVIHCSDGWDRTSQICSLVEICVDPYYRSLEGFMVLIEKEWNSFGHQFNERCGHLASEVKFYNNTEEGNFQKIRNLNQKFKHSQNQKMESPVFQQFLECVYQLVRQNKNEFEFNERFLRRLVYHLYSCQYGTFLVDCEKEKYELQLEERTRSVWDYFNSRQKEFRNEEYIGGKEGLNESEDDVSKGVLDVNYTDVVYWRELYGREL